MRAGNAAMPLAVFMNALPPGHEPPPGFSVPPSAVPILAAALKAFTDASTLAHVAASSPPVLLLHGDADTEVPFQQSVAMEAALHAANVSTKLVRLTGGGHGANFVIDGPSDSVAAPLLLNVGSSAEGTRPEPVHALDLQPRRKVSSSRERHRERARDRRPGHAAVESSP
jgi:acetyl esterase/lipase